MNTATIKLATIQVHSVIDVITNSSTEIFCTVEGKTEEAIQKVIDKILKDFDCECLKDGDFGIYVQQHYDYSGDEDVLVKGQFDIYYNYGCKPCKMIREEIEKKFTVVEIDN